MNTTINITVGIGIIVLNLIPLFTKQKYFAITVPLSLLLGAIVVLFVN